MQAKILNDGLIYTQKAIFLFEDCFAMKVVFRYDIVF